MRKGFQTLVNEAMAEVHTLSVEEAAGKLGDPAVQFIDLREPRELERDGMIPGAFHAPRGLLEFWVDPESPYFKPVFGSNKAFVLFCAAGWRSALAAKTLQDMGMEHIAHVDGGFAAWKTAGAPTTAKQADTKTA